MDGHETPTAELGTDITDPGDLEEALGFSLQRLFRAIDKDPSGLNEQELADIENAKRALEQGAQPGDVLVDYGLVAKSQKVWGPLDTDASMQKLMGLEL